MTDRPLNYDQILLRKDHISRKALARIIREEQTEWKTSNGGHYNPMLARVAQRIGKHMFDRELDVVAFEQECCS